MTPYNLWQNQYRTPGKNKVNTTHNMARLAPMNNAPKVLSKWGKGAPDGTVEFADMLF
jgi:hypothetical protein